MNKEQIIKDLGKREEELSRDYLYYNEDLDKQHRIWLCIMDIRNTLNMIMSGKIKIKI